jgi:hypothetical protein
MPKNPGGTTGINCRMIADVLLGCFLSAPAIPPTDLPRFVTPASIPADTQQLSPTVCTSQTSSPPTEPEKPSGNGYNPPPPPPGPSAPPTARARKSTGENWTKLADDSLRFLAIMHAFRYATEAGTRSGGIGLGKGYTNSVGNLHGWDDGDPFYVNYIGHPMQGAVSGRFFLMNNPRYYRTEFGKDPEYWKGKLAATAFAWAFSEQFEIGVLSEASIGHIQAYYPQQGFVDHVITPTMGLVWMVGEDAIDRYIIVPLEDRYTNRWVRRAFRMGLNPARSFANLVDARPPWERGSRAGTIAYRREPHNSSAARVVAAAPELEPKPAPFEFSVASGYRQLSGTPCMGGGAEGALRLADELQLVLAVNGCKILGLPAYHTGDALVYQIGPRWTPAPVNKWSPYAHLLVGGLKVTQEQLDPEKRAFLEEGNPNLDAGVVNKLHDQYTTHEESSGLAVTAGAGIDYKLKPALAFRVLGVEYLRSNVHPVNGMNVSSGFQVSTGMVLRLGTW